MDKNSLSHTTWECKYHLVFAPKYRRQVIYGKIKADVAEILSMLCKRKGIKIIEAECCKDHIHMLLRRYGREKCEKDRGYIQNQIKNDLEYDQITLNEYIDPFTGEPVRKSRK